MHKVNLADISQNIIASQLLRLLANLWMKLLVKYAVSIMYASVALFNALDVPIRQ